VGSAEKIFKVMGSKVKDADGNVLNSIEPEQLKKYEPKRKKIFIIVRK